jgi:hypothetical protein
MKIAAAVTHPDVYPDRHLNVFVPYGAHDLDYNVTRAVIATLRWSAPDVTRDFLAEIVRFKVEDAPGFQYDLQGSDFEDYDPSRAKRKIILGISSAGKCAAHLPPIDAIDRQRLVQALHAPPGIARLKAIATVIGRHEIDPDEAACLAHAVAELQAGSLPDGWIFSTDGQVCVLIEAKLLALLDPSQLDRHAEVWFGKKRTGDDLVIASWTQVAHFFGARRDHKDPRTAFLCRQVFDYIDLLGFAPFEGFKPYDFDGDTLPDALPKFRRFAADVRTIATQQGAPLSEIHSTPTGARFGFVSMRYPGEIRLDLATDGVRVSWFVAEKEAERVLHATGDGARNPWAGMKVASTGLVLRVERLIEGDHGLVPDAETYAKDLDPARFPEALHELRLQNPRTQEGREVRHGALEVVGTVARDAALDGRDAVIGAASKLVSDMLALAEKVHSE